MEPALKKAFLEGLADAFGFVLGAIAGWQIGTALGFDFVNTPGWGTPQLIGLVLIIAGIAGGRWLFRRLAAKLQP